MKVMCDVAQNQTDALRIAQVLEEHQCSVFSILYDPESIYKYTVWAKYDPDVISHDEIRDALYPSSS